MHPKQKHIYVGLDNHKNSQTAVIIDCFGTKLGETTVRNTTEDFQRFLNEVKSYCKRGITPLFGMEDALEYGRALTVFLISKKQTVKKVNSSLTKSERSNQSIIHKDDSHDALCVARVLLTKLEELHAAEVTDVYWTLSMLVNRREAIVKSNTAIKNQMHALISHHYRSYQKFFTVFDCPTALAFWEEYPSPGKLKNATVETLGKLLYEKSHRMYGAGKAKEIFELIEKDGDTTTQYQESRDFMITTCIKQLRSNAEEIKKLEDEMQKVMSELGQKLETMVGIELVAAASFIAEIGNIDRFANADKLAKYAGISPISYSSGQKDRHFKNQQGNRTLYNLFRELAARNISPGRKGGKPTNPIFYQYYNKKISEGKTEKQALICVMRRLVNIIYAMLKNKTAYRHPVLSKKRNE